MIHEFQHLADHCLVSDDPVAFALSFACKSKANWRSNAVRSIDPSDWQGIQSPNWEKSIQRQGSDTVRS